MGFRFEITQLIKRDMPQVRDKILPIEAALESVRPAAQAKSIQLDADLDSAAGAMGDSQDYQRAAPSHNDFRYAQRPC